MFVQDDEKRLLYYQRNQKIKYKKLACFDLDHTFITTKKWFNVSKNIVEIEVI